MPITRTAMVDDDGSGTTGTIFNNAWKTELYGQIDGLAGDTWKAFTPIVKSDSLVTLTATVVLSQWRRLSPETVIWMFNVNPIVVAAVTTAFFVTNLPFAPLQSKQVTPVGMGNFLWVAQPEPAVSTTTLKFSRTDAALWPAGNCYVQGTIILAA